jgi:hypothetical protein
VSSQEFGNARTADLVRILPLRVFQWKLKEKERKLKYRLECIESNNLKGQTKTFVKERDHPFLGFYEQFGFTRLSGDSPRLFLPLKSVNRREMGSDHGERLVNKDVG